MNEINTDNERRGQRAGRRRGGKGHEKNEGVEGRSGRGRGETHERGMTM